MKKWRFISNQNSTFSGINDAGIETFTADIFRSLTREILQNSIDAAIPNSECPVHVEFKLFDISTSDIPDSNNLHNAMQKCFLSNQDEPDASKFFKNAHALLSAPSIKVLRISDYNTVGLEGSDTCAKGTNWSRLVKESGSSNKESSSGGSFGIGKSAAFACSDLRTVFYSSLNQSNHQSNIGVSKLISFKDDFLGWTTGVGYYSADEKFVAIPELSTLDSSFTRSISGTDIYILGVHQDNNILKLLKKYVLLDFFISILKKKLTVSIQDEIIDIEQLPRHMSELNPYEGKEIKELLDYYHLLSSSDPTIIKIPLISDIYGKKYGFGDGECTLYLKESEGYNNRILITRKAGMRIFEQDRLPGSCEFTGVLIIDGANMNKTFKAMEVPSHDAWAPGRCRENKALYEKIFAELRTYLRNQVKESFGKTNVTSIDAFGASEFLPDKIAQSAEEKLKKNELSTRVQTVSGTLIKPSKKKSKQTDLIEPNSQDKSSGSSKGDIPHPPKPYPPHPGPEPGPEPGPYPGLTPTPSPSGDKDGKKIGYKLIPVKKRLACSSAERGTYLLNFISPSTAKYGKLEFTLTGEQSDFDLPVKEAKLLLAQSGVVVSGISDNTIYLENMKKGDQIKIEIVVDFDTYCMMEVDYYANKK